MDKQKKKRLIWLVIFIVYAVVLLRLTVFRTGSYPTDYKINLSLFTDLVATYYENGIWMVLYLVLGNIAWFVPFGFILPKLWKGVKPYQVIFLGFLFSLIIESLQLVTGKGMFEIDDLVFNTAGAAMGLLAHKICCRLWK